MLLALLQQMKSMSFLVRGDQLLQTEMLQMMLLLKILINDARLVKHDVSGLLIESPLIVWHQES